MSLTRGLFDRLLDVPVHGSTSATVSRVSAEDMKDSVVRDLEALLNTRSPIPEELLKDFPECSLSIVTYGLNDFADRSISSPDDRAYICQCIQKAISRHEPRLRNVKVQLDVREDVVNRLNFSIKALLVVNILQESVNFDAVLQPSTLRYSISKASRAASGGG
ncbi:type VI secretion system baseplate subunit TssE [Massilia horti]|uniref:Type VI secretion system baseplate subunit TssE n=1 Tax=Massilia horti TaxID=2562153 RepID=A0A4Y9T1Y4_9BURK|nr:type VI secretion system baseplate subunit TssE [Massilia horti]TFW31010.1 type VI secretion system baseplate subunit TssE [Massilia horti]